MGLLVTLLLAVLFISAKAGPLRPINSVSAPPSEPSNSKKVPSDFDASVDGIDNSRTSVTSSEVSTAVSTDADVQALMEKYKGRFLRCEVPGQPQVRDCQRIDMFLTRGLVLYTAVASLESPSLLLSFSVITQHHHTNNNPSFNP